MNASQMNDFLTHSLIMVNSAALTEIDPHRLAKDIVEFQCSRAEENGYKVPETLEELLTLMLDELNLHHEDLLDSRLDDEERRGHGDLAIKYNVACMALLKRGILPASKDVVFPPQEGDPCPNCNMPMQQEIIGNISCQACWMESQL